MTVQSTFNQDQAEEENEWREGESETPTKSASSSNIGEDRDLAGPSSRSTTFMEVLRDNKYISAKMKNIKIYTDEEIASPQSNMERKRRWFWEGKAEQLVKSPKTSHCGKTTIGGIIDVAWTLRKTSFIEGEARKLIQDEKKSYLQKKTLKRETSLGNKKATW